MDDSDFDIDPALAAQMGFSTFGGSDKDKRAAKRQKQDHSQSYHQFTGANNIPVGAPRPTRPEASTSTQTPVPGADAQADPQTVAEIEDGEGSADAKQVGGGGRNGGHGGGQSQSYGQMSRSRHEGGQGQGYGQGAQGRGYQRTNAAGDAIYYDPSFIEDPWAGLTAKRWGER